jgi:transposase InsO family protein
MKLAQVLCRAGLHLSTATVGRALNSMPQPRPVRRAAAKSKAVLSRGPGHVWLADFTVVPTSLGLWTSWLPVGLPQRWPFCFWVAVVIDHYSRRIMGLAVFRQQPTSLAVRTILARIVRTAGACPRYLVTDQGRQFRDRELRRWCSRRGIHQRFGTVGRHGATAVVERLIRTIKEECTRRLLVPFASRPFSRELSLYSGWYNKQRPHHGFRSATPDEVYQEVVPASMRPRFEPRVRWPRDSACAAPRVPVRGRCGVRLDLDVHYIAGRKHLPIVTLRHAA